MQAQGGEVGEVADDGGDLCELVCAQAQLGEVGQVADPVGKGGEPVSIQGQPGEVGEVADPGGNSVQPRLWKSATVPLMWLRNSYGTPDCVIRCISLCRRLAFDSVIGAER